mmetsp:Transcript_21186/g.61621  ORF Transcript_21186/g.61621 Transcript_21186/m.61621 type:complete len:285 (-) Transcript_21186:636-1490(-)
MAPSLLPCLLDPYPCLHRTAVHLVHPPMVPPADHPASFCRQGRSPLRPSEGGGICLPSYPLPSFQQDRVRPAWASCASLPEEEACPLPSSPAVARVHETGTPPRAPFHLFRSGGSPPAPCQPSGRPRPQSGPPRRSVPPPPRQSGGPSCASLPRPRRGGSRCASPCRTSSPHPSLLPWVLHLPWPPPGPYLLLLLPPRRPCTHRTDATARPNPSRSPPRSSGRPPRTSSVGIRSRIAPPTPKGRSFAARTRGPAPPGTGRLQMSRRMGRAVLSRIPPRRECRHP